MDLLPVATAHSSHFVRCVCADCMLVSTELLVSSTSELHSMMNENREAGTPNDAATSMIDKCRACLASSETLKNLLPADIVMTVSIPRCHHLPSIVAQTVGLQVVLGIPRPPPLRSCALLCNPAGVCDKDGRRRHRLTRAAGRRGGVTGGAVPWVRDPTNKHVV
jgi:hypothetical protein